MPATTWPTHNLLLTQQGLLQPQKAHACTTELKELKVDRALNLIHLMGQ
jgi:hypothetical protein